MGIWDFLGKSSDDNDEINKKADLAAMASGLDSEVRLDPNASLSTNSSLAEADAKVKKEKFRTEYRKYLENDDGSTTSSLMASALMAVLPAVAGYAFDKTRGAGNALAAAGQAIPNVYAAEKKASDEKKAKKLALLQLDKQDATDSSKLAQSLTMKAIDAKQKEEERVQRFEDSKSLARYQETLRRGRPGSSINFTEDEVHFLVPQSKENPDIVPVMQGLGQKLGRGSINALYAAGQAQRFLPEKVRELAVSANTIDSVIDPVVEKIKEVTKGKTPEQVYTEKVLFSNLPLTAQNTLTAELDRLAQKVGVDEQGRSASDADMRVLRAYLAGSSALALGDVLTRLERLREIPKNRLRATHELFSNNPAMFNAAKEIYEGSPQIFQQAPKKDQPLSREDDIASLQRQAAELRSLIEANKK